LITFLARKKDRRFIRYVEVIEEEECATQYKLFVCDILLKRCSEKTRVFMPRRNMWKLKNITEKCAFYNEMKHKKTNKYNLINLS